MAKRLGGLVKRSDIWHIDKQIRGYGRLCESTGSSSLVEAEQFLVRRLDQIRQQIVYGAQPPHTWRDAATRYLREHRHLRSIADTAWHLKMLDAWIGSRDLTQIHDGTLEPFVRRRLNVDRVKNKTVNLSLEVVRRILNKASHSWRDESGKTWLKSAPAITMLDISDARQPYPLSWEEQAILLRELPAHLQSMTLFKVNTGTREHEVCSLRWDWEVAVPELDTSVFLIPGSEVKNKQERLVVLNSVAKSVVAECRGRHHEYVFTWFRGEKHKPVRYMNNNGWQHARVRAAAIFEQEHGRPAAPGFGMVRVHDLKHTFGRRLRAAGVGLETRKVLLGHTTGDITSHYSVPELQELIDAAERVCATSKSRKSPAFTLLKRKA